jgi:hypothetical protein
VVEIDGEASPGSATGGAFFLPSKRSSRNRESGRLSKQLGSLVPLSALAAALIIGSGKLTGARRLREAESSRWVK